jgi:hypothetical protein
MVTGASPSRSHLTSHSSATAWKVFAAACLAAIRARFFSSAGSIPSVSFFLASSRRARLGEAYGWPSAEMELLLLVQEPIVEAP